jgi:hypothetical protein
MVDEVDVEVGVSLQDQVAISAPDPEAIALAH